MDKWETINRWRLKNDMPVRRLAREMGVPYWVLYNALTKRTKRMFDYHMARVEDWLTKNEL